MGRRAFAAVGAGAALALAGCGSSGNGGGDRATAPTYAKVATPRVVRAACADLARSRRVPVLCPAVLPDGRWFVTQRTLRDGSCTYLTDIQTAKPGPVDPFHAEFGGRCEPLPLRTRGTTWPARPDDHDYLGLVGVNVRGTGRTKRGPTPGAGARVQRPRPVRTTVLGHTSVHGRPALLLSVRGEQVPSAHTGTTAVIWNERGHGYVLSLHFADRTLALDEQQRPALSAERRRLVLAIARRTRAAVPSPAPGQ